MDRLSNRKEHILRAVIVEYVSAAEPVASDLLAEKYSLGVKSATIRSELAEISGLGLLEQPHTSAGRIPSDQGYRYFVDRLIIDAPLDKERKQKVKETTDEEETLQELLKHTTRTLSRLTHLLTAAVTVRESKLTVKNAILTVLGPSRGLLVMVMSNGLVENRVLEIPKGSTLEHIGRINEALSRYAESKTLRSLMRSSPPPMGDPTLDRLLKNVCNKIQDVAKQVTSGKVIFEGEEYIIAQPEFQRDPALLERLLESLEDENALREAVLADTSNVSTVTIGKEHASDRLHILSILRQNFSVANEEAGTLAIIGPTRMNYEHGLRLLNFTALAIGETLTRVLR